MKIYRERQNLIRIYQLQIDIAKAVKGDKAFHIYLNSLKSMWNELQLHRPLLTSLKMLKKKEEEDRIFKLLAGLVSNFKNVRCTMLMM